MLLVPRTQRCITASACPWEGEGDLTGKDSNFDLHAPSRQNRRLGKRYGIARLSSSRKIRISAPIQDEQPFPSQLQDVLGAETLSFAHSNRTVAHPQEVADLCGPPCREPQHHFTNAGHAA